MSEQKQRPLWVDFDEIVDGVRYRGRRAVCEPDGYCHDGHICGRLDLGIVREAGSEDDRDVALDSAAARFQKHVEATDE